MTGLRPDSTKVWDLNTHFRDHVPDVVTVSQYFKNHGYQSISMGKIYHGGFDDALSWSEPALKPGTGSRYVLKRNLAGSFGDGLVKQLGNASAGKSYCERDAGIPRRQFFHQQACSMLGKRGVI